MTIAELYGKLSPNRPNGCNNRMEDLLTSDVFGAMKYAGWQYGFLEWLRSSIDPTEKESSAASFIPADNEIEQIYYHFWPTLENGREPDLLMQVVCSSGEIDLIMVEAKYLSGPSDFNLDIEMDTSITGNQIADQINAFPDQWNKKKVRSKIHIYLTGHFVCPKDVYNTAIPLIKNSAVWFFWLNWQSLDPHLKDKKYDLDEGIKLLLQDLCRLLSKKKLINFAGFQKIQLKFVPNIPVNGFWKEKWWSVSPPSFPMANSYWRGE